MPEVLPQAAQDLLDYVTNPALRIVAHLGVNPIAPEINSLALADMVEASFPGYAAVLVVDWDLIDNAEEFYAEVVSQILEWTAGAIVTPQVVTSVYLTQQKGSDPVEMLWPFPLPAQIVFDTLGQVYQKTVRVSSANIDGL